MSNTNSTVTFECDTVIVKDHSLMTQWSDGVPLNFEDYNTLVFSGKGKKYTWHIIEAKLSDVANVEKLMPRKYITRDGFHITDEARDYFAPLIHGEDYPRYKNGIPQYVRLKKHLEKKKLKKWKAS